MELYGQVRRAVYVEGISRREAARRFGIDPRTVAKMLAFSVPPGCRRSQQAGAAQLRRAGPRLARQRNDRPRAQARDEQYRRWMGRPGVARGTWRSRTLHAGAG